MQKTKKTNEIAPSLAVAELQHVVHVLGDLPLARKQRHAGILQKIRSGFIFTLSLYLSVVHGLPRSLLLSTVSA